MERWISPGRSLGSIIAVIGALLVASAPASAHGDSRGHGDHGVVRAALPSGAVKHIFVIELENEDASTTFGPGSPATYLNGTLVPQGELVENYYATGHASLDNYIAQISGQAPTEETSADCLGPSTNLNTLIGSYDDLLPGNLDPNERLYPGQVDGHGCIYPAFVQTIANQLDRLDPPNPFTHVAAWRDYDEDMGNQPTGRELGTPDPLGGLDCAHPALNGPDNTNAASPATATEPADQYATRHNGFVYFHSIIDNKAYCDAHVVDLRPLAGSLKRLSATPNYSFITPDTCADAHDTPRCQNGQKGGLPQANRFLKVWIPRIMHSPAYRAGGLIVVTFDESGDDTDATACCGEKDGLGFDDPSHPNVNEPGLYGPGGGRVGAVLLSTFIRPGTVSQVPYNHYSLLRSIEDLFGLAHLGDAKQPQVHSFGRDVYTRFK